MFNPLSLKLEAAGIIDEGTTAAKEKEIQLAKEKVAAEKEKKRLDTLAKQDAEQKKREDLVKPIQYMYDIKKTRPFLRHLLQAFLYEQTSYVAEGEITTNCPILNIPITSVSNALSDFFATTTTTTDIGVKSEKSDVVISSQARYLLRIWYMDYIMITGKLLCKGHKK